MKTKFTLLIFMSLLISCHTIRSNDKYTRDDKVVGNGKVITKKVNITDYDRISMAGNMELVYEQTGGAPFFEIMVDENIFPYLNIEVKGSKLVVETKQDHRNIHIQPTKYKIRTNSRNLKQVEFAGSGDFTLKNLKKSDKVNISMAGSGRTLVNNMEGNDINIDMAGSGSVEVRDLRVKSVFANMAGSGKIKLEGRAENGRLNMAGNGKIQADDCRIQDVRTDIAGSGSISVNASDNITNNIAGSGSLYYKGNPSLNSKAQGSGRVKRID